VNGISHSPVFYFVKSLRAMNRHPIINGREVEGGAGIHPVLDPFDGSTVGSVTYATADQAASAIAAADHVFQFTRSQPVSTRAEVLARCSIGLGERKEPIAQLITQESGKPIDYARAEVDRAVYTFKIASEAAVHARDRTNVDLSGASNGLDRKAHYRYFPLGVILAITPFNFPLNLVAHKIAPAIAAGNTIVLKPAPQTPLTSFMLSDILAECGLIPGALNVVPCDNDVAETMVKHPLVKMVSFTGSAAVGWKLKTLAAKARVTLELGGNGMMIVDEIIDMNKLVKSIVMAAFNYAGQVCIGLQNLLVKRSLHEGLVEALLDAIKTIGIADPKQEGAIVGPMISSQAAEKVERWISDAVAKGAKRLSGEFRQPNFISPTILTEVPHDCDLWAEEAFAPILNVEPYDDLAEALRIVNQSRYGLQASIFTNDRAKIDMAYERLEVGAVIVNDTNNFRVDSMPYGGVKNSGFGREGVLYAMKEMSEMKLLIEK
jgi:acyl-CoA reductase-like NAD-dependent aldehyde dehydrogenase